MLFIIYCAFILCLDTCIIWVKCIKSGSKLLIIIVAIITACEFKIFQILFVGKSLLSPWNWFYTLVRNQLTMYLHPYFWSPLYSINQPACLDTNVTLSWFLDHRRTLHFHLNLRINLSFSFPTLTPYGIFFIGIGYIDPLKMNCCLKLIESSDPWTQFIFIFV